MPERPKTVTLTTDQFDALLVEAYVEAAEELCAALLNDVARNNTEVRERAYTGPVPPELRDWVAATRALCDQVRANGFVV